jgi:hypothetical protein
MRHWFRDNIILLESHLQSYLKLKALFYLETTKIQWTKDINNQYTTKL